MGFESKTSGRRVRGHSRQLAALELRMRGMTFEAIGQELGFSAQAAHATVHRALARTAARADESAENLRVLELLRLDAMLTALWPSVEKGDVSAINAALRVSERRAKLVGLDAAKVEASDRPLTLVDIFARPMPRDANGNIILTREPTEYDAEILAGMREK